MESPESILATALGVVTGIAICRRVFKSDFVLVKPDGIPPGSWLKNADLNTVQTVGVAISAGFKMAHNSPPERRHAALREATFQVPYEMARYNKDAKDFRLENMGPPPPLPAEMLELPPSMLGVEEGFDVEEDVRVSLYYPKGATKAAAAFVAINSELSVPDVTRPVAIQRTEDDAKRSRLLELAMAFFLNKYRTWARTEPEILERMETGSGRIQVIFVFRDKAGGAEFDTNQLRYPEGQTLGFIFGLSERPEGN